MADIHFFNLSLLIIINIVTSIYTLYNFYIIPITIKTFSLHCINNNVNRYFLAIIS